MQLWLLLKLDTLLFLTLDDNHNTREKNVLGWNGSSGLLEMRFKERRFLAETSVTNR